MADLKKQTNKKVSKHSDDKTNFFMWFLAYVRIEIWVLEEMHREELQNHSPWDFAAQVVGLKLFLSLWNRMCFSTKQ